MKTALITGASRGIGKELSRALASNDYNLHLICEKNMESLKEFCKDLEKEYGILAVPHQCDVSSYESMEKIFSKLDSLDVLINNAGISYVGLITDMTIEEWNRIVSVNLSSCFYTCKLATPLMLKSHSGKIINISSVWGNVGASMEVAYSATKGGVNGFTKALAKELAPSNISVNAIACGFVDTEMNSHLNEKEREAVRAEIPADRFATPLDISKTMLGIINSSNYLTGQVITVDGGWT